MKKLAQLFFKQKSKANNPSQWMQIAERLNFDTGVKDLDLESPVFDSPVEFVKFHTR